MFTILNERSKFKEARPLVIFKYKTKKYLLYIVNDYEDNDYNVMVSYIQKNNDGYNYLIDVNNEDELKVIKNKFSLIIGGGKNE